MKKHGTSNILLIELVLVILFFMLCASVIVEAFGGARLKSREARSRSEAMMTVENLEARLAGEENTEGMLESSGFLPEEDRWVLREKDYTLTAGGKNRRRHPADGGLRGPSGKRGGAV